MADELVRSVLFMPASNPRAIDKARTLPCDVAVLDLEDAVAPEMKTAARAAAVEAARSGGFGPRLAVRVNGLDTPWGSDDLDALAGTPVEIIVAPKVEDARDVAELGDRLPAGAALWAMIETPLALFNLDALCRVDGALAALMFGTNDLSAALGCGLVADREPLKPWLAATVAAARAHGLGVIDGVFNRLDDADGFASECNQGRLYGFDGKSLIHPGQIATANATFSPTDDEVAHAMALVAAFADPAAAGRGAIQVEGSMVERLHLTAAEALLRRHDACSRSPD
ncbi:CoA ester lyase [uncultured Brevundimonas sp.]|uniref:HpcH/HpaI aldolase/citrate lyase family protein n=1 Tax=uncultured Brevundimonas sp. TaxID=213418 RepID=UPI0030EB2816|tara:strand:- start:6203 stop:7054 length:852 start_codon:yes stop_codon:yes gene_type:complete